MLAQLGNRVQHALRAFTPDDAKALKATVTTFPKSEFYDLEQLLTAARHRRGGGDDPVRDRRADAGRAHAAAPPASRMGPADDVDGPAKASPLYAKYGTRVDTQSAREMLAARLAPPAEAAPPAGSGRRGSAPAAPLLPRSTSSPLPRTGSPPPSTRKPRALSRAGCRGVLVPAVQGGQEAAEGSGARRLRLLKKRL